MATIERRMGDRAPKELGLTSDASIRIASKRYSRQVTERGVAGAEPVEHERRADFAHPLQEGRGVFRVLHHQTFRRGELERAALDVMAAERGAHVEQQVVAEHLARGGRDRREDGRIDLKRLLPRRELPRGRLESIGADVDDRAGRLGGREELIVAEDARVSDGASG